MKKLAMYINGAFETGFTGQWRDVLQPRHWKKRLHKSPKVVRRCGSRRGRRCTPPSPRGQRLPAVERGAYLRKIAAGIRARADALTDTIVAEGGKTKDLARVEK